jgi:hypothetical protein
VDRGLPRGWKRTKRSGVGGRVGAQTGSPGGQESRAKLLDRSEFGRARAEPGHGLNAGGSAPAGARGVPLRRCPQAVAGFGPGAGSRAHRLGGPGRESRSGPGRVRTCGRARATPQDRGPRSRGEPRRDLRHGPDHAKWRGPSHAGPDGPEGRTRGAAHRPRSGDSRRPARGVARRPRSGDRGPAWRHGPTRATPDGSPRRVRGDGSHRQPARWGHAVAPARAHVHRFARGRASRSAPGAGDRHGDAVAPGPGALGPRDRARPRASAWSRAGGRVGTWHRWPNAG